MPRHLLIQTHDNVPVGPATAYLHELRGGLLRPNKLSRSLRHRRYERVIDRSILTRTEERSLAPLEDGSYFYGGIACSHFGHFIAEYVHRLWALKQCSADTVVLFCLQQGETEPPAFFYPVMHYLGVSNIRLISENVIVPQLTIAQSGKFLGTKSHMENIEFMATCAEKHSLFSGPKIEKLALTRGHIPSRRLFGEGILEDRLREDGYLAYRPEEHTLLEQLGTLCRSKNIVIADGSACHLYDLLPQTDANVFFYGADRQVDLAGTSILPKVVQLSRFESFRKSRMRLTLDGVSVWRGSITSGDIMALGQSLFKAGFTAGPFAQLTPKRLSAELALMPRIFGQQEGQSISERLMDTLVNSRATLSRIRDALAQPKTAYIRRFLKRFR